MMSALSGSVHSPPAPSHLRCHGASRFSLTSRKCPTPLGSRKTRFAATSRRVLAARICRDALNLTQALPESNDSRQCTGFQRSSTVSSASETGVFGGRTAEDTHVSRTTKRECPRFFPRFFRFSITRQGSSNRGHLPGRARAEQRPHSRAWVSSVPLGSFRIVGVPDFQPCHLSPRGFEMETTRGGEL